MRSEEQMRNQMVAEMGPEAGMEEEPMGGGYCIEIRVSDDGSISVSSEMISDEEYGEEPGTPVGSIGEAVKTAMDIYENGGEAGAGEEEFQAGFGGSAVREGE